MKRQLALCFFIAVCLGLALINVFLDDLRELASASTTLACCGSFIIKKVKGDNNNTATTNNDSIDPPPPPSPLPVKSEKSNPIKKSAVDYSQSTPALRRFPNNNSNGVGNSSSTTTTTTCSNFYNGEWSTRLLRCGLYLTAGFGYRILCLNGCLLAAKKLGLTLLYDQEFYEYQKYIMDRSTADELLHLSDALPTWESARQCLPDLSSTTTTTRAVVRLLDIQNVTGTFDFEPLWPRIAPGLLKTVVESKQGSSSSSSQVVVFDMLRRGESGHQDNTCPLKSTDFRVTAAFFRTLLSRSASLGGSPANLALFRPGSHIVNVAIHVRNGDRLPGKSYEKNVHLNLSDDYYLTVVSQIAVAAAACTPPRSLHVVAFGASVVHHQQSDEKKESNQQLLLDAVGNASRIPVKLPSMENVASWKIRVNGDWKSDVAHFATADVLIAARSGTSRAAAVMSSGVVIVPPRESFDVEEARQGLCHVAARSDGKLDVAKLTRALSNTTCQARQNVSASIGV